MRPDWSFRARRTLADAQIAVRGWHPIAAALVAVTLGAGAAAAFYAGDNAGALFMTWFGG